MDSVVNQELRMVLVGKTGAGKSSSGNTLLRRKWFYAEFSSASVTSECERKRGEFEGQPLVVVDTPGLSDTSLSRERVTQEIVKCVSFAAPGPHVFLVVIVPNRFTKEEEETVKIIQQLFGQKAAEYTIALFTHGDELEDNGVPVERLINQNAALRSFVRQCRGGYHVFNNRSEDPEQVRELLRKINQMVSNNGGTHYTNEMLQEAENAIREEMERLQREETQLAATEARRRAERRNGFMSAFLLEVLSACGEAVGGLSGADGREVGRALGRVVASLVENQSCSIQ